MLSQQLIKQINDFVYIKPRTIEEISVHISKNWRTANSYVEQIAKEQGTLSVRVFREGTRGALKIVFWNNIEKIHSSSLQERLYRQIESGRRKKDFSPLEIYQYVDEKKKNARIMNADQYASKSNFDDFAGFLGAADKQILFFSGNLTWSNFSYHGKKIIDIIEELAKQGVSIKILTRVELPGIESIKNVLAINERIGKRAIEIRHCFQPLRTTIVDGKSARFKEMLDSSEYPGDELGKDICLLYEIFDQEWIEWLQKVFWNLFRTSIDAEKRINEIGAIKKI